RFRCNPPARTGSALDNKGHTLRPANLVSQQTDQEIQAAARWNRYDDLDCSRNLRRGAPARQYDGGKQRGSSRCHMQESTLGKFHVALQNGVVRATSNASLLYFAIIQAAPFGCKACLPCHDDSGLERIPYRSSMRTLAYTAAKDDASATRATGWPYISR